MLAALKSFFTGRAPARNFRGYSLTYVESQENDDQFKRSGTIYVASSSIGALIRREKIADGQKYVEIIRDGVKRVVWETEGAYSEEPTIGAASARIVRRDDPDSLNDGASTKTITHKSLMLGRRSISREIARRDGAGFIEHWRVIEDEELHIYLRIEKPNGYRYEVKSINLSAPNQDLFAIPPNFRKVEPRRLDGKSNTS